MENLENIIINVLNINYSNKNNSINDSILLFNNTVSNLKKILIDIEECNVNLEETLHNISNKNDVLFNFLNSTNKILYKIFNEQYKMIKSVDSNLNEIQKQSLINEFSKININDYEYFLSKFKNVIDNENNNSRIIKFNTLQLNKYAHNYLLHNDLPLYNLLSNDKEFIKRNNQKSKIDIIDNSKDINDVDNKTKNKTFLKFLLSIIKGDSYENNVDYQIVDNLKNKYNKINNNLQLFNNPIVNVLQDYVQNNYVKAINDYAKNKKIDAQFNRVITVFENIEIFSNVLLDLAKNEINEKDFEDIKLNIDKLIDNSNNLLEVQKNQENEITKDKLKNMLKQVANNNLGYKL